ALVEGVWTADTVRAVFLRRPSAPPPGKRLLSALPEGHLPTLLARVLESAEEWARSHDRDGGSGGGAAAALSLIGGEEMVRKEHASSVDSGCTTTSLASGPACNSSLAAGAPFASSSGASGSDGGGDIADGDAGPDGCGDGRAEPAQLVPLWGFRVPPLEADDHVVGEPPMRAISRSLSPPKALREAVPWRRLSADGSGGFVDKGNNDGCDASLSTLESSSSSVSLAVAAGCSSGGGDDAVDGKAFHPGGDGVQVHVTRPLDRAVLGPLGFPLCLPFLRMGRTQRAAALRILVGMLESSPDVRAAFCDRSGFDVLFYVLTAPPPGIVRSSGEGAVVAARGEQQFAKVGGTTADGGSAAAVAPAGAAAVAAFGASPTAAAAKRVQSSDALRLVVDILCDCRHDGMLQGRVMEALVDTLDGSPASIRAWHRAFGGSRILAPLLQVLAPASFVAEAGAGLAESAETGALMAQPGSSAVAAVGWGAVSRSDGGGGGCGGGGGDEVLSASAIPAVHSQAVRMVQVLIAGSAAPAARVRPADGTAAPAASSYTYPYSSAKPTLTTAAGATPDHIGALAAFVLRCHRDVEARVEACREAAVAAVTAAAAAASRRPRDDYSDDDDDDGVRYGDRRHSGWATADVPWARPRGGCVCSALLELLIQLCSGDGGALVVGMLRTALLGNGHFLFALELMSSSIVETRVAAIKLLSLMLVRMGEADGGGSGGGGSSGGGGGGSSGGGSGGEQDLVPGPDSAALKQFMKIGGFAVMCRVLGACVPTQGVCDALLGMVFGVWGSREEPNRMREKDVMAIKSGRESWLKSWSLWTPVSSTP
ncbi:unnamed protein product, partial [Phaeothamnion confervicola]